jgi:hypothetical protein
MLRSLARFSGLESFNHTRSSAAFITVTFEFRFSVRTVVLAQRAGAATASHLDFFSIHSVAASRTKITAKMAAPVRAAVRMSRRERP